MNRKNVVGALVLLALSAAANVRAETLSGSANPVRYENPFQGNYAAEVDPRVHFRFPTWLNNAVSYHSGSSDSIVTENGDLETNDAWISLSTADVSRFKAGTLLHSNVSNAGYDRSLAYEIFVGNLFVGSFEMDIGSPRAYFLDELEYATTTTNLFVQFTSMPAWQSETFRQGTLTLVHPIPDRLRKLDMTVASSSFDAATDWYDGLPSHMLNLFPDKTWQDDGREPAGEYWTVLDIADGPKTIDAMLVQNRNMAYQSEDIEIFAPDGNGGWTSIVKIDDLGDSRYTIFRLTSPVTVSQLRIEIPDTDPLDAYGRRYVATFMVFEVLPDKTRGTQLMLF